MMIDSTTTLHQENARLRQRLIEVEQVLYRRDAILEALGDAARFFFEADDPRENVPHVLGLLGQATGVSRVYIFENNYAPDETLLMSQRYEWVSTGIDPQLGNPDLEYLSYLDMGFARWTELLGRGEPLYGHTTHFPPEEREILEPQDILSLAVFPIFVGQQWWGFIGFDDCVSSRTWSLVEIKALKAVASMFGSALYHHQASQEELRMQQEIIQAQETRLQELSTPLLPLTSGVLAMPLIGTIDAVRVEQILSTLLEGVVTYQAHTVLLDITGVQVVDTQIAQALMRTAQAVRLLGARIILTGISPSIAQTLVHLGVDLSEIMTRSTLQEGIAQVLHMFK
jgi:anti-anti-sigma regulatory factor